MLFWVVICFGVHHNSNGGPPFFQDEKVDIEAAKKRPRPEWFLDCNGRGMSWDVCKMVYKLYNK